MNYNQSETASGTERDPRRSDSAMIAELLARLDRKQEESKQEEVHRSIDLIELFYYLLSKLRYIVLGMVLGGILLGIYGGLLVTPIYEATSKIYIMGSTGSSILTDLQIGSALAQDYQEVFKTWEVHQMVNESLGTSYGYTELENMVSIDNPGDTHIISITVSNPDPQAAADIANAYADAAKTFIAQTMDTDEPNTFSYALVPSKAGGISTTGYIIRGILLGTAVACVWLILNFLLDSRPKTPEDIMRYANIPTLAVFPANPSLSGDRAHRKKERKL